MGQGRNGVIMGWDGLVMITSFLQKKLTDLKIALFLISGEASTHMIMASLCS